MAEDDTLKTKADPLFHVVDPTVFLCISIHIALMARPDDGQAYSAIQYRC